MSEVKLNIVDSQHVYAGIIHGSIADLAIAALSAEPETVAELKQALARYQKPARSFSPFGYFVARATIDDEPHDVGIVIIDLVARIVAAESTFSKPGPRGQVRYHDGKQATEVNILYRVPDDWRFVYSLDDYRALRVKRALRRASQPPWDARQVLFGRPLAEFIAYELAALANAEGAEELWNAVAWFHQNNQAESDSSRAADLYREQIEKHVSAIHSRWLMTSRSDLQDTFPREIFFARQDFISFDLHTRELQWSLLGEGPPCLLKDSVAFRYGGFGVHEWVVYYDLVRELINTAVDHQWKFKTTQPVTPDDLIMKLEQRALAWLEEPQAEYGGAIPAIIIENERKRLPLALHPRELVIDEDCPMCQMMADESALGGGPGFWHLDGSHMEDDFVFSLYHTRDEWEQHRKEWAEFSAEYNRRWQLRQQQLARGERVEHDPLLDSEHEVVEVEKRREIDPVLLM